MCDLMNSSKLEKVINLATKDSKKGTRVLAKIFYRILRSKGFSENQIIDIATNILNCLIEKLNGYEKKIDKAKEHEKEVNKKYTFQQAKVAGTYTKFRSRHSDRESSQYCA